MIEIGMPSGSEGAWGTSAPGAASPTGMPGSREWNLPGIPHAADCGAVDPSCRQTLERILKGLNAFPISIDAGVRLSQSGAGVAIQFSTSLIATDMRAGEARVLPFELIYLPEQKGVRIRFSLAQATVAFFCRDQETGATQPPFAGVIKDSCRPESLAVGANLFDIQHDTETARWAARWLEANFVYNFLRNGNTAEYLRRRLSAYAGMSLDSVWFGSTPGAPAGGSSFSPRMNVGLTGLLRTDNYRWELRGFAGVRPNFVEWSDWAVESRVQVLHHILFSRSILGTVGLDAQYSHWNMPSRCIGITCSDRDPDSGYIGALFGVVFR